MSDFLKGNYDLEEEIVDKSDESESAQDEFKEKALNSIGGSMVFVEREQYVWDGDDEDTQGNSD